MAEAILNFKGRPNFTAYSAGSHPSGAVRPEALRQLEFAHVPAQGLRSKSWEEFAAAGRAEARLRLHRVRQRGEGSLPGVAGSAYDCALGHARSSRGTRARPTRWNVLFARRSCMLERRISLFLCLPLASLDKLALKKELDNIGQTSAVTRP